MASAVPELPEPDKRGWQVGKSLATCLQNLLDQELCCDVTFQIRCPGEPCTTVTAHKLILTARSPVFEAMFSGAFNERSGEVTICDIPPEPFKALLRYMYTDEVNLTGYNVMHLLAAAKKYFLDGLVTKCRAFLDTELTQGNVCSILTDSLFYQDDCLIQKCLDLIAPNAKAISKSESFYNMSYDALLKLLQYDQLALGVEADLFEGCLEWGKRQVQRQTRGEPKVATGAEIRRVLGDCLYQIRFPYISTDDFVNKFKFGKTSVLTDSEKSAILCLSVSNDGEDRSYHEYLSENGFNTASRMIRGERFEEEYKERFTLDDFELIEVFTLSVNSPVKLMGFSVYGGDADTEHDMMITMKKLTSKAEKDADDTDDTGKKRKQKNDDSTKSNAQVCSAECKIKSPGGDQPIPVTLSERFLVEPHIQYEVKICLKAKSLMGCDDTLKSSCSWEDVTFTQDMVKWPFEDDTSFVPEILFQKC